MKSSDTSTRHPNSTNPSALRPFKIGQYRALAAALTLSLLSTGLWTVGAVFQTVALGGGPVQLSWVAGLASAGILVAVLVGGAVADQMPQRNILIAVASAKIAATGLLAGLSAAGAIELIHLAVAALVLGITDGFFFPAYSALLPTIIPEEQLLAANGVEGVLRPVAMLAVGPAAAGLLLEISAEWTVFAAITISQLLALISLSRLGVGLRTQRPVTVGHAQQGPLQGIIEGLRYGLRTRWLIATLLLASGIILLVQGPIEVLLPFVVRANTGGGAGEFALALAGFGIGGAAGAITVASRPLPRRYLSALAIWWGIGTAPLAIIGFTSHLWVIIAAMFAVGFTYSAGAVIWGTLLQRRVPAHLLGRVSSLDFFVSLAFLPLSVVIAGPLGEAIGYAPVFVLAAVAPALFTLAAILGGKLRSDETANPLADSTPSASAHHH